MDILGSSTTPLQKVTLRAVENYIKFLKDRKLIYFEGAQKKGKYKITEKYKKLKKKL